MLRKLLLTGLILGIFQGSVLAQTNGLLREVYTGISGDTVANLTNNAAFPDSPSSTNYVTDFFEAPINIADNYGQRLRGFIIAPQTGNYIFWIASDDNSVLFVSTNETPANKRIVASVSGWTSSRQWNKFAEQQSAPVSLVAGQRYYIEALMKEAAGGDNLAVRWQLPDTTIEEPIPANRLIAWGSAISPPTITQSPTNMTVVEGQAAIFSVRVSNLDPLYYQWKRGVTDIPGANGSTYTIANVALTDNGAQFSCFLTNSLGTTNCAAATLFVTPDTNAPTLTYAVNLGNTNVQVIFNEPVAVASATTVTNYTLNNGVTIAAAAFGSDTRTIILTTSPLTFGSNYTLKVSNIKDRAATPNTIAANSTFVFFCSEFVPQDVGNPALGGSQTRLTNGFAITGAGSDIGGSADQLQFSYQLRTGNFDVKARVESLNLADVWTKAGLVAREDLSTGGRFAGAMATPGLSGCFFESRDPAGSLASVTGSFPVNYPAMWLRLQRVGNQFIGYASYDGQTWTQLGTASIAMPATVYFGLAVSSHNAGQLATAQFRDVADVSSAVVAVQAVNFEPLGPSSRKTGLVISEIMYKPAPRTDGKNLEFIELFNSNPYYEDISGYRISGEVDYTFSPNTILPAGGFLVIAKVPADIQSVYGIANVVGPYTNSLGSSGTIRLRSKLDAIYLEIPYDHKAPWPLGADGAGHSLVLARPSYGEADPHAWDISDVAGGSPGGYEGYRPSPLRSVVINEFLAHTDPPLLDYIELYNHANTAVDISGCVITDDPTTNRFVIPASTIIPARGFISFNETALGFRLDAVGETIYFKNTNNTRVLDAVQFEGQENSVSMGRSPDGASEFYPMQTGTPGAANSAVLVRDIVINEIMYNPISGNDDDQYVELYNKGASTVNLGGWRFVSGIDYTFPTNQTLAPNSYLVVAANVTNLLAHYGNLNTNNTVGNFGGKLSHSGERLALAMWDQVVNTNTPGVTKTNIAWIVVDEVTYREGGRWGKWADGGGSSLELIDARSNHRLAYNWADSDETAKASWTTIEATGVMDNGANYGNGSVDIVQLGLLGEGECLFDEVEVLPNGSGANIVSNPGFESGTAGWILQGDHIRSTFDSVGAYAGTKCLHVRASDQMWVGANSAQGVLTDTNLVANQTVTLRFKARWLRGWPEALMRLHGNWFEAIGKLPVPANLGTPGAVNSRRVANAGPAIYEVSHFPSIPATNQNVVVSARVNDPDAVSSVQLKMRMDPASSYSTTTMLDNGTGGDAVAGDGIYSATIPGQASGGIVAFYVQATDGSSATTRFPTDLTNGAPVRVCVVYFGDTVPTSSFGTYHLWLTKTNIDLWSSLPDLSNEPIDGTWVYGNRVIYNMTSRYAGSPYHQWYDSPVGAPCHYSCEMPGDDKLFGTTSMNKIHSPGNSFDDDSIQREQTAYWMIRQLGLPWNYRRYVAMYVNGNRRGTLLEDTQVPNDEVINENFPDDSDGQLFKIQPWFEFGTNGTSFDNKSWCTMLNYTTTGGVKKVARYRWNYLTRMAQSTVNDFTNLFALIDAANSYNSPNYVSIMNAEADMEMWMRTFAIAHACGNWDTYTYQSSQNTYAYKPTNGPWKLLSWDFNILFGISNSHGPGGDNLFKTSDSTAAQIYANPTFRRAYLRAFKEIANGPMSNVAADPIMDAKFNAFAASGITVSSPSAIKTWISTMHNSLLTALTNENANAAFAITSNAGNNFSTNKNYLTITGTAPVEVKTILINGVVWPVTWNSVTGWTATIALNGGTNLIAIQGLDNTGNPVAGGSDSITINYTGPVELPQDRLVINEIMYNAALPDAGFIEIYNSSTNFAFDLSGWRLDGADFTFPGSSVIQPNGYLVVAGDSQGFINAYGNAIPLAGFYDGNLQNSGETLKLVRPGINDVAIDEVTYDSAPPWPSVANGFGPSLQLIDSAQDNNRVGNWAAINQPPSTNAQSLIVITNTWKYNQAGTSLGTTWRDTGYNDTNWSSGQALLYVETAPLPAPTNAPLTLGATTYYFRAHFTFNGDPAKAVLTLNTVLDDGAVIYLNGAEAFRMGMGTGTIAYTNPATRTVGDAAYEGPFIIPSTNLVSGDNVIAVEVHQINAGSSDIVMGLTLNSTSVGGGSPYTPGAVNSVKAVLPAQPLVWLNEVQPNNLTGLQDNFGERDPWVELYNSGSNAVDLSNFYLSDNYSNLTRWVFPAATAINPGQFRVVWLDNQTGQTAGTNLHANFRASSTNGTVVLVKVIGGVTNIVDYLNYKPLNNDRSYGAFTDGTSAKRQIFYHATPGGTNNNSWPSTLITVNEWMASNTNTLTDPADGHFDDWFELYNAGPTPADLSGYTLTDNLTNKTQFTIPSGYVVPANGYLLVWADNDSNQNKTNDPNLHVNFALSKSGEAFGLFTPAGVAVDTITFGAQTNDVSQGRWPDGNSGSYYYMTTPTPGAANVLGNATNLPPVLGFIPDQNAYQGSLLTFTASATDPNSGQTKTYSLDVGAPTTAFINPNSGVFSWTPSQSDVPGDYFATIRVTDNGMPPLDDSQSVKLTVLAPPILQFSTITPNGDGTVTFHWATQPESNYRILYKTDLGETDWTPLTDMPSGGTNLSFTIGITNDPQRYFLIELLQ